MLVGICEGVVGRGDVLGVAGVAVHVAVGVGCAAVGEEVHELVDSLVVVAEVVPELEREVSGKKPWRGD